MTAAALLVGTAAAAALAAGAGPRRTLRPAAEPRGAPAADGCVPGHLAAVALPWRRRRRTGSEDGRLAAVLVEVASLLRAGTAPADAWSQVLRIPVPDRVPTVARLAGATGAAGRDGAASRWVGGARRTRGAAGPPLEAVVAAARVADELGAPLAAVLDQVAAAVVAQAESAAEVAAALAGPRSSARVLAWLPVLGILLGTALGANPAGVLLGGGLGTAAGALGLVLVLVGRWWTAALLRRAARVGGDP